MLVQWIDNAGGFNGLREEWDRLLVRSSSASVFLTWEWLRTWWNHLSSQCTGDRRLMILALRHEGELIAIAPFALHVAPPRRWLPLRRVEFLGTGTVGSDYLDVIVREDLEDDALDMLAQSVRHWSVMLELGQFRSDHAPRFGKSLAPWGWRASCARTHTCPYIDLRGHSWETYLSTLGSEHRYNVRRKMNALNKRFRVSFDLVEDECQLDEAMDTLIALHNKRWDGRGVSEAFPTDGHIDFHHDFARLALRRGWLRLFVLRLDDQPVSALYGLRYGPTFSFYQSGFDPEYSRHSVGLVTMAMAIQRAIAEGAEEYDFLHGTEAYKFHWAKQSRDLVRLKLYPPGLRGACLQAGSVATEWMKRGIRGAIGTGLHVGSRPLTESRTCG